MLVGILTKTWWRGAGKDGPEGEEPPVEIEEEGEPTVGRSEPPSSREDDEDEEEFDAPEGDDESSEPFNIVEDPLAPAFDLDIGRPMRGRDDRRSKGTTAPSNVVKSAKEFFATEILYRFDILENPERAQIAGRYRIELKGNKGGVWTLFLNDDLEIVNRREEAELVLTMQHRDFIGLVNGDLNPQLAMLAQKVKVQGSLRQAINFYTILVPYHE